MTRTASVAMSRPALATGPAAARRAARPQVIAGFSTLAIGAIASLTGIAVGEPWTWAIVHGVLAACIARLSGDGRLRQALHGVFVPMALAGALLPVPASVWLAVAGALLLTSHNALRERVPLFLSSQAARRQLVALLPRDRPVRFLDAGCGTGGVVIEVAREVPTLGCTGLETAWLPWLVARLRCAVAPNGARALRHDLWHYPLSSVDVLYAYLSPVPMGRLWDKACAEMASGSLFISNTFEVPGAAPETSVPVDDLTGAVLHLYRIPARATA